MPTHLPLIAPLPTLASSLDARTFTDALQSFPAEWTAIATLTPHPRNYRAHPADQLAHIQASIQAHGFYRNIVVAEDGTILAGHGVVQAARALGYTQVPVIRLPLAADDERAMQILVGDNEMPRLSENDDRVLTELLKELHDADPASLLGTGFDAAMLAGLTYVTRPASEIRDKDTAAQWVGMPEYENAPETLKVVVSFRCAEDRLAFAAKLGLDIPDTTRTTISTWYPPKEHEDLASLRFED